MARKQTRPPLSLMLNSGSDYSIVDHRGDTWSLGDARAAWEAGKVTDCNLAFQRLAGVGFNLESLKQHYARGGR